VADPRDNHPTLAERGIDKHLADQAAVMPLHPAERVEGGFDYKTGRSAGYQRAGNTDPRQTAGINSAAVSSCPIPVVADARPEVSRRLSPISPPSAIDARPARDVKINEFDRNTK